jgi:hypothetical protein
LVVDSPSCAKTIHQRQEWDQADLIDLASHGFMRLQNEDKLTSRMVFECLLEHANWALDSTFAREMWKVAAILAR